MKAHLTRRLTGWFTVLNLALAAAVVASAMMRIDPADARPSSGGGVETRQATAEPDTTGDELWAHLTEADYQKEWQLWPGTTKLYKGTEPHGALLSIYVNDLVLDAITNGAARFSDGAIIVKENYMPDEKLAALTVMFKRKGYNVDAGDWYWVKYLADGKVDMDGMAQGRVEMCIACHGGVKQHDYVFTRAFQAAE